MSTFMIAGKDFYQYVAYRLKKDGIGYTPSSRWHDGSTDTKTFIKAILPKTAFDFLVYVHELGHCKSEQLPRSMGSSFFGFHDVCDNTLQNEYNAWVWAIRYMRKLKIVVSAEEMTKALKDSFLTYARKADNKRFANNLIEKLNDMLGINLEMESVRPTRHSECTLLWTSSKSLDSFEGKVMKWMGEWLPAAGDTPATSKDWDDYFFPVMPSKSQKVKGAITPTSTNKKHKPWMDLMDKKRKHSWKNHKGA